MGGEGRAGALGVPGRRALGRATAGAGAPRCPGCCAWRGCCGVRGRVGSGAAWGRGRLTFYYVLPGEAPLRLRSEKQATARVMSREVLGKMFMMQMLGKKKWVSTAACGLAAPRDETVRWGCTHTGREQARAAPRGWGAVSMEASAS